MSQEVSHRFTQMCLGWVPWEMSEVRRLSLVDWMERKDSPSQTRQYLA